MEEWSTIPGFEKYDASTHGNIRRDGRVLKGSDTSGYLIVNLYKDGIPYHKLIHRLVALTFLSNPLNKLTVNHIDEIKTNNRLDNLEWATQSEQKIHSPGPIGVSGHRHIRQKANSWKVEITRNYKTVFYKTCQTLEEAIEARDIFIQNLQPT